MPGAPDFSSYYNSPDIQQAQQQATQSQQTASNYQSAAALLPSMLKNAIEQKVNYNKDIIDQQAKAQADYFAAPAQARQQYQDIFNPFDREALVAKATANAYAPYQSLTDILGQRQGNIADIVQQGTGAFQSEVGAEQNASQIAQNNLQNLMAQAQNLVSAKQWQYQMNQPTGGGSGSFGAGTAGEAGGVLQQAIQDVQSSKGGSATATDLFNYITAMAPSWQAQGVNVSKVWQLMRQTYPQGGNPNQSLIGGTKQPKTSQTAISAKTSTVKGNAKLDGWNLKLSNGQTAFVTQPQQQGGDWLSNIENFFTGKKPQQVAKPKETAQQVYNDWKSSGLPESALIQALQNAGYTIQ